MTQKFYKSIFLFAFSVFLQSACAKSTSEQKWGEAEPCISDVERQNYESAKTTCRIALNITEEKYGLEHPVTVTARFGLAETYLFYKKYDLAEPFLLKNYEIAKKQTDHPKIRVLMALYLAECYYGLEKHDLEAKMWEEVIEQRRVHRIETSASEAFEAYTGLATAYRLQGLLDKSLEAFNMSDALISQMSADEKSNGVLSLYKLSRARLYIKLAKFGEAEKLLLEAYQLDKTDFGENSQAVAEVYYALAELNKSVGKKDAFLDYKERAYNACVKSADGDLDFCEEIKALD